MLKALFRAHWCASGEVSFSENQAFPRDIFGDGECVGAPPTHCQKGGPGPEAGECWGKDGAERCPFGVEIILSSGVLKNPQQHSSPFLNESRRGLCVEGIHPPCIGRKDTEEVDGRNRICTTDLRKPACPFLGTFPGSTAPAPALGLVMTSLLSLFNLVLSSWAFSLLPQLRFPLGLFVYKQLYVFS